MFVSEVQLFIKFVAVVKYLWVLQFFVHYVLKFRNVYKMFICMYMFLFCEGLCVYLVSISVSALALCILK